MNMAIFLLFALPIGSAIAKGIFGKKLGSLVTGGAVGTLAFVVTTSLVIAGVAGFVALLFALFSGASTMMNSGRSGRNGGWGLRWRRRFWRRWILAAVAAGARVVVVISVVEALRATGNKMAHPNFFKRFASLVRHRWMDASDCRRSSAHMTWPNALMQRMTGQRTTTQR
jgi:hypothetical protein